MADKMPQIVCVGRQYGSGGREIGERLAEKLGVPCYDKLLIKKTAAESGLSEDFIRQEEETPAQSRWFLSGNAFADAAAISEAFYSGSQMIYDAEQKVIRQLAEKGPCVIVGRCASELLKGSNVLSVFIYADEQDCVARVMKRNQLSEHEAAKRIKHVDRMRKKYFACYADSEWGQPESYDLMLSSSKFGIDGCVELILGSLAQMKGEASVE